MNPGTIEQGEDKTHILVEDIFDVANHLGACFKIQTQHIHLYWKDTDLSPCSSHVELEGIRYLSVKKTS